jgi:hypothetical protein
MGCVFNWHITPVEHAVHASIRRGLIAGARRGWHHDDFSNRRAPQTSTLWACAGRPAPRTMPDYDRRAGWADRRLFEVSMGPTNGPGEALVERAVATLRRISDRHRQFVADPGVFVRQRIGDRLLARLIDHGLPHRGTGQRRRFDPLDAQNLGLLLGLPSPRRISMRWWRKALHTGEAHAAQVFTIEIRSTEDAGEAEDGHRYALNPALVATAVAGSVSRDADAFVLRARVHRARGRAGPAATALADEVARLQFHLLPRALRTDLAFLARTGLADCHLATLYLVTRATELGLPLRKAEGLFVVYPYATRHCWPEYQAGDEWIAFDPFMLNALARWNVIDPREWPPTRSTQSALWRLGPEAFPLLERDGVAVRSSIRVLAAEPAMD